MRDFFDKFALLGTLAAIGFVDVIRGARAAGGEEAHGMSSVFQSVERRDTKFDFSTKRTTSSRRSETILLLQMMIGMYKLTLYDVLFWFITSYTV